MVYISDLIMYVVSDNANLKHEYPTDNFIIVSHQMWNFNISGIRSMMLQKLRNYLSLSLCQCLSLSAKKKLR